MIREILIFRNKTLYVSLQNVIYKNEMKFLISFS